MIFRQGVVPLLFNAGEATIQGFEAELRYRPDLRPDSSRAGSARSTTRSRASRRFRAAVATVAPGDDLPLTPAFQGNLALSVPYRPERPFHADAARRRQLHLERDLHHAGQRSADRTGRLFGRQRLADARRRDQGWRLTTGVPNLFDERYLVQGNASLGTLGYAERMYARPRSWFLQLAVEF